MGGGRALGRDYSAGGTTINRASFVAGGPEAFPIDVDFPRIARQCETVQ